MDNPAFAIDLQKPDVLKDSTTNNNNNESQSIHSYEEAISLVKIGKFHYILLLICGMSFMSVIVESMGVSLIMGMAKCDLNFGIKEQGFLASAGFLGVVTSSYAMGLIADTWGRVKTLKCSIFCSIVTSVISAFSVSIWMLIAFRFLNGFFVSGCQACVFSLIGEFHGNSTRVRHVTVLSIFLPVGLMYFPGVALVMLPLNINFDVFGMEFTSWRILLLTNSLISISAFIGFILLPESPKFLLGQGRHDECLEILSQCFAINTGKSKSEYPVTKVYLKDSGANIQDISSVGDALRLIWTQTVPLFNKQRLGYTLNISFMMFVIFGISQGTFMWFPIVLNEIVKSIGSDLTVCQTIENMSHDVVLSSNQTRLVGPEECRAESVDMYMFEVLVYIGLAYALIYLFFSFIINIIGKKRLLILWLVVAMVCCIGIHWVNMFILNVILLTLTMAVGNCGGIITTIAMQFYPTNINAMGISFAMTIGRLGAVAGSNIIGVLLFSQCENLFYSYVGIIICLVFLTLFLPSAKSSKATRVTQA